MRPSRLRSGELVALGGAIALLVLLFAAGWYADPRRSGWVAIPVLRWFVIVLAVLGIALAVAQAAFAAPALPVTLDLIAAPLGTVVCVLLAVRLASTGARLEAGAYGSIAAALVTTAGAWLALRLERGWAPGPEHPIELIELPGSPDLG